MTDDPTDPGRPPEEQRPSGRSPTPPPTPISAVDAAQLAVGRLHLGSWADAGPRLLPRLVPRRRAGTHSIGLDRLDGGREPGPRLDLALDADDAVVRVDDALLASWDRPPAEVWRRAKANLAARSPAVADLAGPGRLVALSDGRWTTGWIAIADRLPGVGDRPGPGGRLLAAAPASDLLLLVAPAAGRPDTAEVVERLTGIAMALTAAAADPLSPAVLAVPRSSAFGAGEPFPTTASLE